MWLAHATLSSITWKHWAQEVGDFHLKMGFNKVGIGIGLDI